jgi:glycerol kinase
LTAMQKDTGIFPETLCVDGGLVTNKFVCQFLANILQIRVEIAPVTETTALGAAYLAGLFAGVYNDLESIAHDREHGVSYTPKISALEQHKLYTGWQKILSMLI